MVDFTKTTCAAGNCAMTVNSSCFLAFHKKWSTSEKGMLLWKMARRYCDCGGHLELGEGGINYDTHVHYDGSQETTSKLVKLRWKFLGESKVYEWFVAVKSLGIHPLRMFLQISFCFHWRHEGNF